MFTLKNLVCVCVSVCVCVWVGVCICERAHLDVCLHIVCVHPWTFNRNVCVLAPVSLYARERVRVRVCACVRALCTPVQLLWAALSQMVLSDTTYQRYCLGKANPRR